MPPTGEQTQEVSTSAGSNGGSTVVQPGNNSVAAELRRVTEELTRAGSKITELEKANATLTQANKQANEQLAQVQANLGQSSTALQAREADLTNLQTQFGQVNAQVQDLTAKNSELTQKVGLFNLIASTPEYHSLIGASEQLMKVVRPDASPDDIKALLGTFATSTQQQTQLALESWRAGGSPTGNFGAGQAQPVKFKNIREAHQAYNSALAMGDPIRANEAYQAVLAFQNQPSTPA